jgi:hypothetical protein
VQEAQHSPLSHDNAALLLQSLEKIANEMQQLSLGPIQPLAMAAEPMFARYQYHQAGPQPHQAADPQLDANNHLPQDELQPEVVVNQEPHKPATKRKRVARPKGQAPTRSSNRLAGRAPAPPLVVPEVNAPVAPMPYVVAAPIAVAPVLVAPVIVAEAAADFAPDVVMQDEPDVDQFDEDEPMQVVEQQEVAEVHALPLTRLQLRRLAATGGWQAFMTPLPEEVPEGELGPRMAAKVCRAKNKYLAAALYPNLCE